MYYKMTNMTLKKYVSYYKVFVITEFHYNNSIFQALVPINNFQKQTNDTKIKKMTIFFLYIGIIMAK